MEWVEEENYCFKLESFKNDLLNYLSEGRLLPEGRANEIKYYVEHNLKDLSVSRLHSKVSWGIPSPRTLSAAILPRPAVASPNQLQYAGDHQHSMYVWLDALTNYLTVTGFPWEAGCVDGKRFWPADVHVSGC